MLKAEHIPSKINSIADALSRSEFFGNFEILKCIEKGRNEFLSRKQKFNYWNTQDKSARYDRIINELCHFYKVSLITTGLLFHKYPGQKFISTLLSDILAISICYLDVN
jgi:hypothetical protein